MVEILPVLFKGAGARVGAEASEKNTRCHRARAGQKWTGSTTLSSTIPVLIEVEISFSLS